MNRIYKHDPLANGCMSGATCIQVLLIIYYENRNKHSCFSKLFNIPQVSEEKIKQKYDVNHRYYVYVLSHLQQLTKNYNFLLMNY